MIEQPSFSNMMTAEREFWSDPLNRWNETMAKIIGLASGNTELLASYCDNQWNLVAAASEELRESVPSELQDYINTLALDLSEKYRPLLEGEIDE